MQTIIKCVSRSIPQKRHVWKRLSLLLFHCCSLSVTFSQSSTVLSCSVLPWGQLFATPWTVACQAPLSVGILQAKYWSGFLCSPPRDLPHPGTEPGLPHCSQILLPSEPPGKSQHPLALYNSIHRQKSKSLSHVQAIVRIHFSRSQWKKHSRSCLKMQHGFHVLACFC